MYIDTGHGFTPRENGRGALANLQHWMRTVTLNPGPGGSGMSDKEETEAVFWDSPIIEYVPLEWSNCRLVGLWPSQQIPLHSDAPIHGTRYHIPLQTNDGCWVYSDGVWQQLELGRIYTMDPTKPHGAVNWGEELRIHLMIDAEGQ